MVTIRSPILSFSSSSRAGEPCAIRTRTPSRDSAIPSACRPDIRSRNKTAAAMMMKIGSTELITPALMAMVYCSATNSSALPPTHKSAAINARNQIFARMIVHCRRAAAKPNGRMIRKAMKFRQKPSPSGGISPRVERTMIVVVAQKNMVQTRARIGQYAVCCQLFPPSGLGRSLALA